LSAPEAPDLSASLSIPDVAASFQAAVVDVLAEKTRRAAESYGAKRILLSGGVAANLSLREEVSNRASVPVLYPPISLCVDNAAMIAAAGHWHWMREETSDYTLDVAPNLKLVQDQRASKDN